MNKKKTIAEEIKELEDRLQQIRIDIIRDRLDLAMQNKRKQEDISEKHLKKVVPINEELAKLQRMLPASELFEGYEE